MSVVRGGSKKVVIDTRDIHALIDELSLRDVVLAGWSMGTLVIWDYFKQFDSENVMATIVIDQSAYDFTSPDSPMGLFDFTGLCQLMAA
ncbi:alpha/beta hydrolase, partial [bacterium]|nr:alpha/beta hydrolase [bacterium]